MGIISHILNYNKANMSLKRLKLRFQERLNMVENAPRTYEQICLDKLKEIGISSISEWSTAMGYASPNGLTKVIRRIKESMSDKIVIYDNKKPRQYEAR